MAKKATVETEQTFKETGKRIKSTAGEVIGTVATVLLAPATAGFSLIGTGVIIEKKRNRKKLQAKKEEADARKAQEAIEATAKTTKSTKAKSKKPATKKAATKTTAKTAKSTAKKTTKTTR